MKNLLDRFAYTRPAPVPSTPLAFPAATPPPADRRNFLKKTALGGLSLGMLFDHDAHAEVEYISQKVNRSSKPSELRITDMRVAVLTGVPFTSPIIRIDTNQGISGYGEVRDGASAKYALFLKSRILGKNPCNVEQLFKVIKEFGQHGRAAGGVCGVEMALWDLAGKAYGVPVYQMLGGKYRDEVRLYADTPEEKDPTAFAKKMKAERIDKGFTFLKMDFGIELLADTPGTLIGAGVWDVKRQFGNAPVGPRQVGSYSMTKHPFTRVQVTDKGLDILADYVEKVRNAIGYDMPLAADHFGHFDVNTAIRLGKRLERYQLAWLEDMVPWFYHDQWRQITEAIETPTLTGEDIYLKEEFIKLVDAKAVDLIQPDLASSGGILETKKIGDYAEEKGIPMAMHFAGSPISMMANVHCAAATQNFVALEHHGVDVPFWEDLVTGIEKPIVNKGFIRVPDKPGLGVELNEDVAKQHMLKDEQYFAPSDSWNKVESWDRTWS
jgi:L-alanine-DL-glutamate epimerase-like enolase superfamily enzyme